MEVNAKRGYPTCIAGSRASPLEEIGGPEAFMKQQQRFVDGEMTLRLMEICVELQQPLDEETRDMYRAEVDHFGYWLDAEKFDRQTANARLKWYGQGDAQWI